MSLRGLFFGRFEELISTGKACMIVVDVPEVVIWVSDVRRTSDAVA